MPCIRTVSQNEDILPLIIVGERFSSSVVSLAGTLDYPIGQAGLFVILPELSALFLSRLLILCASFLAHS